MYRVKTNNNSKQILSSVTFCKYRILSLGGGKKMVFGGRRWRQRVLDRGGGKPTLDCFHHQQYFAHTWIAPKRTFSTNAIIGILKIVSTSMIRWAGRWRQALHDLRIDYLLFIAFSPIIFVFPFHCGMWKDYLNPINNIWPKVGAEQEEHPITTRRSATISAISTTRRLHCRPYRPFGPWTPSRRWACIKVRGLGPEYTSRFWGICLLPSDSKMCYLQTGSPEITKLELQSKCHFSSSRLVY